MTPTDIIPMRSAGPAEMGGTRQSARKVDQDRQQDGDDAFPHVLQKLKGGGEQPHAKQQSHAANGNEGLHGQNRNMAKTLRTGLGQKDDAAGGDAQTDAGAVADAEAHDDKKDAQEAAIKAGADDAKEPVASLTQLISGMQDQAASANANASASANANVNANANGTGQTRSDATNGSGPLPAAGGIDEAAGSHVANAQEVAVVSIKLETHRAAVHTDAASIAFAERLALVQMGQARAAQASTPGQLPGAAAQAVSALNAASTPRNEGAAAQLKASESTSSARERTSIKPAEELGRGRFVAGDQIGQRGGAESARSAEGGGANNAKSEDGRGSSALIRTEATKSATPSGAVDAGSSAQGSTPLQQISGRILATAQELHQAAAARGSADAATAAQAHNAPVRVLNINLHPEQLGSVTIRMSLVGETLDVQIAAEVGETARMLRNDSDQITDMLRSAGLQVEGLIVRTAVTDASASSNNASGQQQAGQQQQQQPQSNSAQSDARASGGQRGERDAQHPREQDNRGREDETRNQRAAGGGLYI